MNEPGPSRAVPISFATTIDGKGMYQCRAEVIFGDIEGDEHGNVRVLPPYVHDFDVFAENSRVFTEMLTEKQRQRLIDLAIEGASHVY